MKDAEMPDAEMPDAEMPDAEMPDAETPLVALLSLWENEARVLLADLHPEPHPEGVLPQAVVDRRDRALRNLRRTMLPRESRKQRFLWPVVRRRLYEDAEIVDELLHRLRVVERELVRLRWADERSQLFDQQLTVLIGYVNTYLRCEEQLLPRLASQLPAADQARVAARLTAEGGWLPVQPHPDVPATPWIARIATPFAAALDRLRDRLSTAPG
jgi:hypothetical protein